MRVLLAITVLGLNVACLRADDAGNRTSTPVADALDWYSMWFSSTPAAPSVQTCRGELRGNRYSFRCDPLSVVVSAVVDEFGHCSVSSMRPSVGPDDGLRVQTLEHLVPPGVPRRKGAAPQDCGELPLKDGGFELVITPRSRPVNNVLTSSARDAALAYNKRGGDDFCLLRFPNVKTGDPFFHVYEECQGALNAVWEFTIKAGQVADFAQWVYTGKQKNLPPGTEWRQNQTDLWFAVSRPEERKPPGAR